MITNKSCDVAYVTQRCSCVTSKRTFVKRPNTLTQFLSLTNQLFERSCNVSPVTQCPSYVKIKTPVANESD